MRFGLILLLVMLAFGCANLPTQEAAKTKQELQEKRDEEIALSRDEAGVVSTTSAFKDEAPLEDLFAITVRNAHQRPLELDQKQAFTLELSCPQSMTLNLHLQIIREQGEVVADWHFIRELNGRSENIQVACKSALVIEPGEQQRFIVRGAVVYTEVPIIETIGIRILRINGRFLKRAALREW